MTDALTLSLHQTRPIPLAVELAVAPGETLALIGPSGAGKSAILRAIAGLSRVREGRITCGGAIWFDSAAGILVPAHRRRVGLVFQDYALFPHRSARDNVAEAMRHLGRGERRARADALLDRVHLGSARERRPAALSGGERQRVALARALARDPAVLLLDEPFSAVDHPTRRSLHALLAEIRAASPVPILFVTHDVADAAASADRLCLIDRGVVVEAGPVEALLGAPDSRTARWLAR